MYKNLYKVSLYASQIFLQHPIALLTTKCSIPAEKQFGFRMFYENLKKITSGKKTTVFHNIILELANWKKKSYTLLSFFSLQLSCWMCSSHLLREVFALSQNNMREIQYYITRIEESFQTKPKNLLNHTFNDYCLACLSLPTLTNLFNKLCDWFKKLLM